MHNIIMTARDSFVQRGGWRGASQPLAVSPGTAAYTVLKSTGWISTCAPHSLRRRERHQSFLQQTPMHTVSFQGSTDIVPCLFPRRFSPTVDNSWIPGPLLVSWTDGHRATRSSATGIPAEVPVSLHFRKILCGTFLSRTAMLPCCEWPRATLQSFRVHHAIAWEIAKWLCSAASVSLRTSLAFPFHAWAGTGGLLSRRA